MFGKCKHNFKDLVAYSDSTSKRNEKNHFYTDVTIHLYCRKCSTKLDIEYSKTNNHETDIN